MIAKSFGHTSLVSARVKVLRRWRPEIEPNIYHIKDKIFMFDNNVNEIHINIIILILLIYYIFSMNCWHDIYSKYQLPSILTFVGLHWGSQPASTCWEDQETGSGSHFFLWSSLVTCWRFCNEMNRYDMMMMKEEIGQGSLEIWYGY